MFTDLSKNQSFSLQQLIEQNLHEFTLTKKYKEINLHLVDDLVSPLLVKADAKQLQHIFRELLVNAVELAHATKIIVSLKQLLKTEKDILVEFTVEDNGTHISHAEVMGYQQGICEIESKVEEYGGKLESSYVEAIGNTVKFMVKFSWEDSEVTLTNSTFNKLKGKKILLAEDNEINQKIIAHLLRREKLEVDVANDGKEAVELFEKNHYDLLLLDLQMPHMDGYETANYIRRKLKSLVPIVAMTASAFANEQTRCFEVGINQYLSKPFSPDDLFQRLRYFLLNEHRVTHQKPLRQSTRDLYSLQSLKQTSEEDQVLEVLEMFLEKTPQLLAEIRKDIRSREFGSMIKKTAKLKGSLGSLQMQSMMLLVDEIEIFTKTEDYKNIPETVDQLFKEYELVGPMLQRELALLKEKVSAK